MTEFEQQVAKALASAYRNDAEGERYLDLRAVTSLVVAAIDATARAVHDGENGRAIEAAALAALRGET